MSTDTSANILQNVQTYNDSDLGILQNLCPFVSRANKKFKNFDTMLANKGDTVTFDKPPRFNANQNLEISDFGNVEQRVQSLTVNKAINVNYAYNAQQYIFNLEDYMEKFGKSAMAELGTAVESDFASVAETAPYRYFGDGVTQIDSYQKLAQALAKFRNYGAVKGSVDVFVTDLMVPSIIGSGLSQFAPTRNNEIANSWELGTFSNAEYFESNLLPTHISGTCAQTAGQTPLNDLSITAIDSTGTQLTLHSATQVSKTGFVLPFDSATISDTSGGLPLVFLTFTGHQRSQLNVQFSVVTGGNLDGSGNITVVINPPLLTLANDPAGGKNASISKALTTDGTMKVNFLPSHRCALIVGGQALFGAIPRLPDQIPYPTAVSTDMTTGVSLRTYYGSIFGANTQATVHDIIWGKTLVPEYSMKIAVPLSISSL